MFGINLLELLSFIFKIWKFLWKIFAIYVELSGLWAKNSKSLDVWKDDLQMQSGSEIARGNSQNLLRILLLLYL